MERNFKNEDFEQFLKQSADGLRMRPSEKVWKGISRNLNRRRRKFGFFLGISLLATSALGYYITESASTTNHLNQYQAIKANAASVAGSGVITNLRTNTKNTATGDLNESPLKIVGRSNATNSNPGNSQLAQTVTPDITSAPFDGAGNATDASQEFIPTIVDSYPGNQAQDQLIQKNELKQTVSYPLTIESVTNIYRPRQKKGIGLQLFFTPTVSYRRLRENKTYSGNGSSFIGVHDLNSVVNHKPDLGFQLGLMAKYPVSPKVKLRGGLQFNVNRYDIKTYTSSWEVATVRLSNRQNVSQVTGYNNFTGYKADWLQNLYLQVSMPLGAEVRLGGNKNTSFGVASSIQPTYVVGDKTYLISTDYKNYVELPWLVREWNLNTSFETFVSYNTGQIKWQVGPQVRYQLLSSYEKKYPVKEHLYDFGLRIGISLNNR